jgi:hypothetical protein
MATPIRRRGREYFTILKTLPLVPDLAFVFICAIIVLVSNDEYSTVKDLYFYTTGHVSLVPKHFVSKLLNIYHKKL